MSTVLFRLSEEYLGAALVSTKALLPTEWSGTVSTKALLPAEWSGFAVTKALFPVEWGGLPTFSLVLTWNVLQRLSSPLPLTWQIIAPFGAQPLTLTWTVRTASASLALSWRVIPDVITPFKAGPQEPSST